MSLLSGLMKPLADGTDRGDLITCQLGDSNSCSVAVQLVKIFRSAGWNLSGSGYSQAVMTEAPEPILIMINSKPNSSGPITSSEGFPPGAYEIAVAMRNAGINVAFGLDKAVPVTEFRIVVGTHP
jgi:hypothetical protein